MEDEEVTETTSACVCVRWGGGAPVRDNGDPNGAREPRPSAESFPPAFHSRHAQHTARHDRQHTWAKDHQDTRLFVAFMVSRNWSSRSCGTNNAQYSHAHNARMASAHTPRHGAEGAPARQVGGGACARVCARTF